MTDQQKAREDFEAWASACGFDLTTIALMPSVYRDADTCHAYDGWQAALAHASSARGEEGVVVGDAVVWQYRFITDEGPSSFWKECSKANYEYFTGKNRKESIEARQLYTHPATSAEGARDQWSGVPNVVRQMRDCAADIANTKSLTGKWVSDTLSWYADEIDQAIAGRRGDGNG